MRRLVPCLIAVILSLAGCKPRAHDGESVAAPPGDVAGVRAAILYVEEQGDRAAGGLSLHADQLEGLAAALRQRGLAAETLLVAADHDAPVLPSHVDVAIVVDTPALRAAEARMLDAFARAGGTVLSIGPLPAGDGAAVETLGLLFGLDRADAEPKPRDGVSRAQEGAASVLKELPAEIDWGPLASQYWPVRVRGATVLVADEADVPVLAVQSAGPGRAFHLAVLPSGRKFRGWEATPGGVALVEAIIRSSPARGAAAVAPPLRVDLAANRVAHGEGDWPVRVVARLRGGDTNRAAAGTFAVRDAAGTVIASGALRATDVPRWRSRFLVAGIDALPAGLYTVDVAVEGAEPRSAPVRRDSVALSRQLADALSAWLDGLALPVVAPEDALPAGVIEDRALLAWALARALQEPGAPERYRYDLERVVFWLRGLGPRVLADAGLPASALSAYSAGLARALEPARDLISRNLAMELQVLAEQAFQALTARGGDDTAALGARLWPAAELSRVTAIADYRTAAEASARALFGRQIDRDRVPGDGLHGDFFADVNRTTFAPLQWERDRQPGVVLGLLLLAADLEPGPLKTDIHAVLDRFMQGFLLASAERNPYGSVAVGFEAAEPPKPRPDGRALAAPETFRALYYGRADVAPRGVEGLRLALAVAAAERARAGGDPALRRLAREQVNGFLGLNPLGRSLLGPLPAPGPVGRGTEPVPVEPGGDAAPSDGFPEYIWLLVLHTLLFAPPG